MNFPVTVTVPDPLPPGVLLVYDYAAGPVFNGTAQALIAAGLIQPEWIVDLGKNSRAIVLNDDGSFAMPYPEGKRGSYSKEDRRRGLTTIKRAPEEGQLFVTKYRTKDEEREIKLRNREEWERKQALERKMEEERRRARDHDHKEVKRRATLEARAEIAGEHLDELNALMGRTTGDLAFTAESTARILRLLGELRRAFAEAQVTPLEPKPRADGNVIFFPRAAGGQEARP